MADTIDYGKYLEAEPTPLMEHIADWMKEKAEFDPKDARTKEEAFLAGVYLTVHLRGIHQASPENQARLAANRKAAENAEAERAERRAVRAESGAPARGRLPKAAKEEAPAPAKRGRPRKAAAEAVAAEETPAEAPKRRGRPRKAAPAAETPAADNVTPMRRRRTAKPDAAETSPAAGTAAEPAKPVRRRARRGGEAAF